MYFFSLVPLEDNSDNRKIVTNYIIKDTERKCFGITDYDEPEKDNTPEEMAELFFGGIDIYGIKYNFKYIGLLCIHDGIVGIFIDPEYQKRGLGKKALIIFEKIVKDNYKYTELMAEIVSDNEPSIHLFSNLGYQYIEQYDSTMNGNKVTFLKYKKVLSNRQKNIIN